LISCGFDAHRDDPLAGMALSGEGYLAMTRSVRRLADTLCDGRLAFVLEGVVTQALIPKRTGSGRAMAMEVLVATPAIRAMIREDKVHQIYSAMQAGKKFGMQTLNDALYSLYMQDLVTLEECARVSPDPTELKRMIGEPQSAAAHAR